MAVLYLIDARSVLRPTLSAPVLDWSAVGVFDESEGVVTTDSEGVVPAVAPADVDVVSDASTCPFSSGRSLF